MDADSEEKVQNAIMNLTKNRTTLVIAHRLSTITKANRIVVLENGKIVELEYLSQITIPTLLLSGEFDFITHQSCQFYANDLSQAVVAEIKNASHSPNYENPDALKSITEAFLKEFHLCAE